MRLTTLIFLLVLLAGCSSNRKFENADQFKEWIAGKTFTSEGNDLDQLDSHGNYHSPISSLELKFNGSVMTYEGCPPEQYQVSQDLENNWVVSFNTCDKGDPFELVIPPTGDMYLQSYDYDLSHMEEGSSTNVYEKLDAIVTKKVTRGPTMEITDEHDVAEPKPLTKAQVDSAKMVDSTHIADPSKMTADTGKVYDSTQKIKAIETQPIGDDTTSLIVQTNTEKGSQYIMSDKLPLSYQYANMIFTFKANAEKVIMESYNETGLTGTFDCLHQGVYLYINGGMEDIFTCEAGKVKWHHGNTNDVQLYQVKIK